MLSNLFLYRMLGDSRVDPMTLGPRLLGVPFVECAPTQQISYGWVAPRGEDEGNPLEAIDGQLIARVRIETKSVPTLPVKKALKKALDKIEQETGRRPRGKRVKEMKEEIVFSLLPRAFPKQTESTIWIDRVNRMVAVDASSASKADDAMTLLIGMVGEGFRVQGVQTTAHPSVAMGMWLANKDAPFGFTVDRECQLTQPDGEKATVRYQHHSLQIDEIGEHIRQGKLPKSLALTYAGRVSFTLTDELQLKGLDFLDVNTGDTAPAEGKVDLFDANVAIETAEMRNVINALVDALGGLLPEPVAPEAVNADASDDDLYTQAAALVRAECKASISLVQRHLKIGYNRAARLLETMEANGLVSAMGANGARTLLQVAA